MGVVDVNEAGGDPAGMWTREDLVAHLTEGNSVDYLFFWGSSPKVVSAADASCLSQWFAAPFVLQGITYSTAEHWMMAEKARMFSDADALDRILRASSPSEAKGHGRSVRGYSDEVWARARAEVIVAGNLAKFGQNAALGEFLRSTRERVLVEASPHDAIWGIGMNASDPNARIPARWRGQNLLGFALMEVRARMFGTR